MSSFLKGLFVVMKGIIIVPHLQIGKIHLDMKKAEDLIAYLSEYDEKRYLHFQTMRMDGKNFKLDD